MPIVTVRINERVKEEMGRHSHINWSEVMREAIVKRLKDERGRDLAEAVLINERLRRKAPKGWDSTQVIREWRRRRSSSTPQL